MKTVTIIKKLEDMLSLLKNREKWCQGAMAKE